MLKANRAKPLDNFNIRLIFMVCVGMHVRNLGYVSTPSEINTLFWDVSCRCIDELQQKINSIRIDLRDKNDRRCEYAIDLIARYVSLIPNIEQIMGHEPDIPGSKLTNVWANIP